MNIENELLLHWLTWKQQAWALCYLNQPCTEYINTSKFRSLGLRKNTFHGIILLEEILASFPRQNQLNAIPAITTPYTTPACVTPPPNHQDKNSFSQIPHSTSQVPQNKYQMKITDEQHKLQLWTLQTWSLKWQIVDTRNFVRDLPSWIYHHRFSKWMNSSTILII